MKHTCVVCGLEWDEVWQSERGLICELCLTETIDVEEVL